MRWLKQATQKLRSAPEEFFGPSLREQELRILERMRDPQPYYDELRANLWGVLLSDQIKLHCKLYGLIDPLDEAQLKPAAYELRIGRLCSIGGQKRVLSDDESEEAEFTIDPFEVAVIETLERLNMPRYLIARWNVRVRWAYEGLLWVGGPQVDPGYRGHLFCPIYNLSNKPVTLRYREAIASIDFVPTTEFHENSSRPYDAPRQRKRIIFDDYPRLQSGLATLVKEKVGQFEVSLRSLQIQFTQYSVITFAALAILVTALTAVAGKDTRFNVWDFTFALAALAIWFQLFWLYLVQTRLQVRQLGLKQTRLWYIVSLFVPIAIAALSLYFAFDKIYAPPAWAQEIKILQQKEAADISALRDEVKRSHGRGRP
ncbi:MAG TPA: hypothetical protein VMT95_13825 [Candidatus Binatia bacterium]|nr:hypothetical protein [Candidatus Binatia bacterium]